MGWDGMVSHAAPYKPPTMFVIEVQSHSQSHAREWFTPGITAGKGAWY